MDIIEYEMKKWGHFIEVPKIPKVVVVDVQGLPMRVRASPQLEMNKVGSFVAVHGNDAGGYDVTSLRPTALLESGNASAFEEIGAGYLKGPDGYYVDCENEMPRRFTDFHLNFPYIECQMNIDGSREKLYVIDLIDDEGENHRLYVNEDEWGELGAIIDRRFPRCQIFHDAVSKAGLKFKRLAGLVLKRASPKVRIVQTFWGWGERKENGTRLFYHGGRNDCASPKKLFPIITDAAERRIRLATAWTIKDVGDHGVTIPTLTYSLASYLDAPFTDASFPLNFSLMEIGESGLLKSAYSRVVFAPCVFPVDKRLHNIRGTEAAMNLLHQETFDDTLVIDDFNLEGTPADVQKKMRLLRASIRDFSDKSAREKFGGDGKIVKYAIRGGCVVTGETRMTGQIRSAELRYLTVRFPCPLDGDKLRAFQQGSHLWGFFISEFIRFVEANYAEIVRMVESRVPVMRKQAELKALRLADAYIFLVLTAEIIARFLLENGVVSLEEADAWLCEANKNFFALVQEQAEGANQRDPYIRYIEEVFNLIGTGKLRIASSLEAYIAAIEKHEGYADGGLYMLKKDEVYALVSSAFASRNEYLPLSTDDVSRLLKEHGLTKYDGKSCLKKASSKIPGRPRMLALIKEICLKEMEKSTHGKDTF